MARRLSICLEEGCGAKTNGLRCRKHASQKLRKWSSVQDCQRNYTLEKKYGISLEDFETLWVAFRGRCGICSAPLKQTERRRGQSLETVAVDHCHRTGRVRGLLCGRCNKGIGFLRDDPEIMRKALEWIT